MAFINCVACWWGDDLDCKSFCRGRMEYTNVKWKWKSFEKAGGKRLERAAENIWKGLFLWIITVMIKDGDGGDADSFTCVRICFVLYLVRVLRS